MQAPDLIHFIHQLFALDPQEPFKFAAKVATIVGAAIAVTATLITKTYPWLRAKIESRSVSRIFGEDLFTPKSIERAVRYYIPPLCQSVDPAGGEESRLVHSVQAPLFETFDEALGSESDQKYHILLADSGMGKSSAVINYCVRHQRRWRKKYQVAMVPLGIPDADERIKKIENKSKTSLFLDALDEDTLAMVDHVERIRLLIRDTHEFRKVIITCRTQFFSNDEEIPRETGVIKITVRSAGESAEQVFYKIYLTPFSDNQVKAYLKCRYPVWQRKRRKQAFDMVAKIPLLTARPMLLAHIDDLVQSKRDFAFSYQLYEEMVEAWIKREQGFVENSDALRDFSERLAVDLYLNRAKRGAERIPKDELKELAKEWGIPIADHKLSGRSLLNRDADGNFKFAHRSIMEYLFVQRFLNEDRRCLTVEWTDQMKAFLWETLLINGTNIYSLPLLSMKERVTLLCNLMSYAVRTAGINSLRDFTSVTTRTLLLSCALILESQGLSEVRISLIQSSDSSYGVISSSGIRALHIDRELTYFHEMMEYRHWGSKRDFWIVCTDRAALLDADECQVEEISIFKAREKLERALEQSHYFAEYLVVPIITDAFPFPSFVLIATANGDLGKDQLKVFSDIFDPLLRQGHSRVLDSVSSTTVAKVESAHL